MPTMPDPLHHWRSFFFHRAAAGPASTPGPDLDLWIICERALAIAYHDHPSDFPLKRDLLVQKLYTPESLLLHDQHVESYNVDARSGLPATDGHNCGHIVKSLEEEEDHEMQLQENAMPYDAVEALTEELEDEILSQQDVRDIIADLKDPHQSERKIYEMLERLELMQLSFDILKETHVGKVVNEVRSHKNASKRVIKLAKRLVRGWKDLVQVCLTSATDVAQAAETADTTSGASLLNEEEGLPSPPMDEAALLSTPMSTMDMFQLWDLDDDMTLAGHKHPTSVSSQSRRLEAPSTCKQLAEKQQEPNSFHNDEVVKQGLCTLSAKDSVANAQPPGPHNKQDVKRGSTDTHRGSLQLNSKQKGGEKSESTKSVTFSSHTAAAELDFPVGSQAGCAKAPCTHKSPEKPQGSSKLHQDAVKLNVHTSIAKGSPAQFRGQFNKEDSKKGAIGIPRSFMQRDLERKSETKFQNMKPVISSSDEKMETAKRNLRMNYEREENAKRQRTIQILDLHDLPKNGRPRAKTSTVHGRLGSEIRPRALSCR